MSGVRTGHLINNLKALEFGTNIAVNQVSGVCFFAKRKK